MAVFAYARVGAKDPAAREQRAAIERAGYPVDYWYADEGIGGRTPAAERPQLRRLLDQIGTGETLVVSRLDRLGRDALDVSTTVAILAARGVDLVILQLEGVVLTSAEGRSCMTVLSALADMERDLLVERAQAGMARATAGSVKAARPGKPGTAGNPVRRPAPGAGRDS